MITFYSLTIWVNGSTRHGWGVSCCCVCFRLLNAVQETDISPGVDFMKFWCTA
jgi:hypothetical protein